MMAEKRILNVLGQVDEKYIEEAAPGKRANKKPIWMKWGTMAACFALVAVLGIGALQGGWFSSNDIAILDNGDTIHFVKSDVAGGQLSLDYGATIRELTEEEVGTLFGDLPVTANAVFHTVDDQLVGFDGKIGDIIITITTSDLPLRDTIIEGIEETTEVDGVPVTAGYFLTKTSSNGERTAIYYATFELGNSTFYVENAGAESTRETVKNDLAAVIHELIANGELDLSQF